MNFLSDWQQNNRRISRVLRGGATQSKLLRPASAQALVEFALVSIPLLATMFAIFEFGLAFWDVQQLAQATREAAREVAACNNQCDEYPPTGVTSANPSYNLAYKDMRALQAIANKNPTQSSGTKLKLQDINYILIRRVADTTAAGGGDSFTINTQDGRKVDISGQYQVYVPDLDGNYNPVTTKYLPFKDLDSNLAVNFARLRLPNPPTSDGQTPTYGTNWFNTSYASSPCIGNPASGSKSFEDTEKQSQHKGASGFNFTCLYDTSNVTDPTKTWSRGRSICQPSDRFYVEISYKHYWTAPIFPQVGVTISRTNNEDNGLIILSQRVYMKVEPVFFPISNGLCPTGVGV